MSNYAKRKWATKGRVISRCEMECDYTANGQQEKLVGCDFEPISRDHYLPVFFLSNISERNIFNIAL